MDARMAARMPRKFAQAGRALGRHMTNATDMITVARAWRRQMAVTTRAVRYVGALELEETGVVGSVGEVARGK